MTEITFHFNAPNKISYVARLLRKAAQSRTEVVVSGSNEFGPLSECLWAIGATEFVAHAVEADPMHVRAVSPVLLVPTCTDATHRRVVVNIGNSLLDGFSEFDRLIEIVTEETEDRLAARTRWKHYADRGYAVVSHNVAVLKGS